MFGILKSGIKLGVGCFVTIVLLIVLAAGAFYYYCGKKPATRPRNSNRRAARLSAGHGAGIPTLSFKIARASSAVAANDR